MSDFEAWLMENKDSEDMRILYIGYGEEDYDEEDEEIEEDTWEPTEEERLQLERALKNAKDPFEGIDWIGNRMWGGIK